MTSTPSVTGIETREDGNTTVLVVSGPLTMGKGSDELTRKMKELVDKGKRKFLLDLHGVNHLDSAGVSALVTLKSSPLPEYNLETIGLDREKLCRNGVGQLLRAFKVLD